MSFDLTNKNIKDTFQNLLQRTGSNNQLYDLTGNEIGDIRISGSLIAQQYIVSSSVTNQVIAFNSGSTIFGDDDSDTHLFRGSITASGDISASGFVYGKRFYADEGVYFDNISDRAYISTQLKVNGHITASGNISSSGTIIGDVGVIGTDTPSPSMELTVKGNISSSGFLFGERLYVGTNPDRIRLAEDPEGTLFINTPVRATSFYADTNITASGDISSSNQIISKHLILPTTDGTSIGGGGLSFGTPANDHGHIYDDGDNLNIGYNDTEQIVVHDTGTNVTVLGDLKTTSHITASGNISGSSTSRITANEFFAKTRYGFQGTDTQIRISGDTLTIAPGDSDTIDVRDGSTKFIGHITASGNISASGTITAEQLTTSDDLTVGDDIIMSDGGKIKDVAGNDDYIKFDQTNRTIETWIDNGKMLTIGNGQMFIDATISSSGVFELNDTSAQIKMGDNVAGSLDGIVVNGDISASGNIYTTGKITASNGIWTDDDGDVNINNYDGNSGALLGSGKFHFQTSETQQGFTIGAAGGRAFRFDGDSGTNIAIGSAAVGDSDVPKTLTVGGEISASGAIMSSSIYYVKSDQTGSFVVNSDTGSFATGSDVAGILAVTASYLQNSDTASLGDIKVTGQISGSGDLVLGDLDNGSYISASSEGGLSISGSGGAFLTIDGDISASGYITSSGLHVVGNISSSTLQLTNITASGNISSSGGKVYGSQLYGGAVYVGDSALRIRENPTGILESSNPFYVAGKLIVDSHITSSGNISASGTTHTFGGTTTADNLTVNTTFLANRVDRVDNDKKGVEFGDGILVSAGAHITASENISSSGTIYGNQYYVQGGVLGSYSSIDGSVRLSHAGQPTYVNGTKIILSDGVMANDTIIQGGHITASGNITSSATSTGSFGHLIVNGTDVSASLGSGGGGSTNAAGSDTQVQFNDGGTNFGGDAGFTYNKTTDSITLAGHITASGNISASGDISASTFVGGNIYTTRLLIDGDQYIDSSPSYQDSLYTSTNLHTEKSIIVGGTDQGHITASGAISASGKVVAKQFNIKSYDSMDMDGDNLRIGYGSTVKGIEIGRSNDVLGRTIDLFGPVTASGNISASGEVHIMGGMLQVETLNALDGDLTISSDVNSDIIFKQSLSEIVRFSGTGHITASQDISASGDVYADVFKSDNIAVAYNASNTSYLGYNANINRVRIGKNDACQRVEFEGSITASGNIKASGNISASGGVYVNQPKHAIGGQSINYGTGAQLTGSLDTALGKGYGEIISVGGTTVVAGKIYYLKSDGAWAETDADGGVTANAFSSSLLGVALGTNSTTDGMLIKGFAQVSQSGVSVIGQPIYASTQPGTVSGSIADLGSGDVIRVLGYALNAGVNNLSSSIYFNPDSTWVTKS